MHNCRAIAFVLAVGLSGTGFAQDGLPQPPAAPGVLKQAEDRPDVRDSIDARAPENRQVTQLLKRIEDRAQRGDWATAVQQLQSILNQPTDGLVRLGPGKFVSMRSAANALLTRMPRQWKQRYNQQFGAAAQKNLDQALATGDYRAVGDVATRYLQTSAGSDAARAIAIRHFDRGEYGMALRWFEVLETRHGQLPSLIDQLQRAAVQKLAGVDVTPVTERIELDGNTVDQRQLLDGVTASRAGGGGLAEWRMLMGSASRSAYATDRLPLLLEKWNQPLLQSGQATENILRVIQDVKGGPILAGVPVVANNRVACRTVDGVSVFDSETGQLLWRTAREASTSDVFRQKAMISSPSLYRGSRSTDERIKDFFYRDAVHGLLSSDGERLFVIEEQNVPTQSETSARFRNVRNVKTLLKNATNVLAAYDLASGALLWTVGGADSPEAFKPVLAGHYFHGVPAAIGDELYLVSEKDNAIHLQALDATTGEQKWSQLLAYSDIRIERDFARRQLTAQVTVASGMLLCPTTADWLIAVNPLTRGIVWARRHAGSQRVTATQLSQSVPELGERWPASAPVVVGNRVIFTPPEAAHIEVLNLTTGEQVWRRSKGTTQYLAGVADQNAIFVATKRVTALGVEDGKAAWSLNLKPRDVPSGRGVLSPRFLHQPMESGQVVSIDLESGRIAHRTGALRSQKLVANLVMHAGGTLLQTPTSIEAWTLRPTSNAAPLQTPGAKIRQAEIAFADGKADAAIAILDGLQTRELDDATTPRLRKLLLAALISRVQAGAETAGRDLDRLAGLGAEAELISRLRIVHGMKSGDFKGAFGQLVTLYESEASPRIGMEEDFVVNHDNWLAGQLFDTWNQMDDESQASFAETIDRIASDAETKDRFNHVFSFHPLAIASLKERLSGYLTENHFSEAEKVLRIIKRSEPEDTEAAFQCAMALATLGQRLDAVALLEEHGSISQIADLPAPEVSGVERSSWETASWKVRPFVDSSIQSGGTVEVPTYRPDIQFHRDHLCLGRVIDLKRLQVLAMADGKLTWSLPLRGDSSVRSAISMGRSMLLFQGTAISCIAPLEKRVLWERLLRPVVVPRKQIFVPFGGTNAQLSTRTLAGTQGIGVVNEDYILVRSPRSVEVFDAVTGEFRWSRDNIPGTDEIIGTTEAVFIRNRQSETTAFRSSDGLVLTDAKVRQFDQPYPVIGRHFVAVETNGGLFKKQTLRLYDPTTGKNAWSMELDRGDRLSFANDRELVIANRSQLRIVNLITGEATKVKSDLDLNDASVIAIAQGRLFAVTNKKRETGRPDEQKVDGTLTVFDRSTGDKLWDRTVNKGAIILSHFHSLPVLLMTQNEHDYEEVGKDSDKIRLQDLTLLDLQTGKEVAEQKVVSAYTSTYSVRFEPAGRFIEVSTQSGRRYRFEATPTASLDEAAEKGTGEEIDKRDEADKGQGNQPQPR